MARKDSAGAIRFTTDFNHVEVGRTVAYKTGHVVRKPSQALVEAAAGKIEDHVPEEKPASDGE